MSDGMTNLDMKISQFEKLLDDMNAVIREAHSVLKQLRTERREIEKMFQGQDVRDKVQHRVDEVVTVELEKIGPEVRAQTNKIYEKVGKQIDKLIDLSLGKEFATRNDREDLRPQLAKKLRIWLREIVNE